VAGFSKDTHVVVACSSKHIQTVYLADAGTGFVDKVGVKFFFKHKEPSLGLLLHGDTSGALMTGCLQRCLSLAVETHLGEVKVKTNKSLLKWTNVRQFAMDSYFAQQNFPFISRHRLLFFLNKRYCTLTLDSDPVTSLFNCCVNNERLGCHKTPKI